MSTPPPYTNITGISRAIMKDNAQEPLASYNGSARPGELVVDLEVDPPSIYVGNSLGQLTLVSSGGEYGNSNVATYLPTYTGNVGLGNLVFSSSQVQTSAYAGGQGHMMMIDTNRTDTYVEIGSADKPFKTFTAAIAAAEASSATAFTFVLMGCTITENVDFSNKSFTQITIATSCRSVITGNIIITDIPSLSQLVIRNIEVGGTFTLTGEIGPLELTTQAHTPYHREVSIPEPAAALALYLALLPTTCYWSKVVQQPMYSSHTCQEWVVQQNLILFPQDGQ
jgi:hypothetical protein